MFTKTLKYDLRAIWRVWTILSVITFASCIMCGICIRDLMKTEEMLSAYKVWSVLGIVTTVIAVSGYLIASSVLPIVRFYKNFFTDEGYLTFTLPVKRSTLLLSKLASGIIWMLASGTVVILGLTAAFTIAPSFNEGSSTMLGSLSDVFKELFALFGEVNTGWITVYLIEALILLIIYSLFDILLIYSCVTLAGTVTKRIKVPLLILFIYLISSAVSTVGTWIIDAVGMADGLLTENLSTVEVNWLVFLLLLLFIAAMTALCALLYSFMLHRLKRRLNLA